MNVQNIIYFILKLQNFPPDFFFYSYLSNNFSEKHDGKLQFFPSAIQTGASVCVFVFLMSPVPYLFLTLEHFALFFFHSVFPILFFGGGGCFTYKYIKSDLKHKVYLSQLFETTVYKVATASLSVAAVMRVDTVEETA